VAFTLDGSLIATSDLGGKLCIWNTWSGKLLHDYTPGTTILSLTWAGSRTIYCGLGDGSIVSLQLQESEVIILGGWSHTYPVEHLAVDQGKLASGAHSEVCIWKLNGDGCHPVLEHELGQPVRSEDDEVLVTGLHWCTKPGRSAKMLIATYMHHGIYVFETQNWAVLRQIHGDSAPGYMARSSLSPDGVHLAVSNLAYGFDIYDITTGALVLTISHEVGKEYPVPVLFIHGGRAIVGGSTVGTLNIWYVD
ncbi:WD40-repeat-containing domain protein, partial [Trametes maxima]